ncbi:hypothetical protein Tco_0545149 [Tanacetum coccineum]
MKKSMLPKLDANNAKDPHYTKDCPLKEEGKTLEEAYYTQFGRPFQGGGYRAAALGFYQRNNANPSNRASTVCFRNQGALIKTLEIQIGQMSKFHPIRRIPLEKPYTSVRGQTNDVSISKLFELVYYEEKKGFIWNPIRRSVSLKLFISIIPIHWKGKEKRSREMDDPNMTMEEYIKFKEEKARRRGRVFNWQTAIYGKVRVDDDLYDLRSVEAEFPAIVIDDTVTPQDAL